MNFRESPFSKISLFGAREQRGHLTYPYKLDTSQLLKLLQYSFEFSQGQSELQILIHELSRRILPQTRLTRSMYHQLDQEALTHFSQMLHTDGKQRRKPGFHISVTAQQVARETQIQVDCMHLVFNRLHAPPRIYPTDSTVTSNYKRFLKDAMEQNRKLPTQDVIDRILLWILAEDYRHVVRQGGRKRPRSSDTADEVFLKNPKAHPFFSYLLHYLAEGNNTYFQPMDALLEVCRTRFKNLQRSPRTFRRLAQDIFPPNDNFPSPRKMLKEVEKAHRLIPGRSRRGLLKVALRKVA